ncbi:MAG: DNA polymerase III subunit delta [Candidatus Magasanikbacteria bacterium CG10_big_fil_rev_8_21_14_0_10_43_6]|uniref:DNA polymerase III subunit delta n=1 Tax=Candidatus Magasanikbacteria bacterium CG10_big_fil_rev_8_21_14_0_10_43_6 TaxID=1974650 RepID=A0A2M6W0W3_9BACT|nr:MAG: DNA polymerase III subunit delta [Candidatus Magasanikbacteria bacterium CG10_big_fil_rev_8_21_14_0_10_43_6]
MIIFLYGKDTFRSRDQLHKMMAKFRGERDPQGLNVLRMDCEKLSAGEMWEQLFAAPFLAERRMVVLENLLLSKDSEFHTRLLTRIVEQDLPESHIFVFWEGVDAVKKKEAKALFVRLSEEKYAQRFDMLSETKREGWGAAEVRQRGGSIDTDALLYLVRTVSDMWCLSSLIDQLVAYAHGDSITLAAVRMFAPEKVDDNIFNLVDAIVAKQPKKVFAMVQEQYRQGKDVMYMYAMVLRQFRILLEMRDVFERSDVLQSDALAKSIGVHPFVVKKSMPLVKRYSMDELRRVYRELLDMDIGIKTGQGGDPRVLFDIFIGRVCGE